MTLRGVLGYLLVALGGLVLSVLPASSAVAQVPVLRALRDSTPARMLAVTVVVAGLAFAVSAWLELMRYVGHGDATHDRSRTAVVRLATAWWCLPLLLAPPMFSRDAWSYAAQGEMTHLGISPYVWGPSVLHGAIVEAVDPRWLDTPTPYGPLPLVWGAAAARLTSDPWLLAAAHRGLSLVGLALLACAVPRLASRLGRDPARASALVLASPLMLAHSIAGAHNDVLMAGVMAVALVVSIERGWVLGAVLGGLAAAVKIPGGLVCIGVALVSLPVTARASERLRRFVLVGAVAVGALALTGVAAGLGVGWVHALWVPGEVRTPASMTTQVGQLVGLVLQPLDAGVSVDQAVTAARLVGSLAALALAARVALRARTGVPGAAVRATALVMLTAFVLSPAVHPWYLMWCLPLLAVCDLGRRGSAAVLHLSWFLGLVAPLGSLGGAVTALVLAVVLMGIATLRQVVSHRSAGAAPREAVAMVERLTP